MGTGGVANGASEPLSVPEAPGAFRVGRGGKPGRAGVDGVLG
ncbi:hypothetical protein AB0H86_27080 [Streptomyces sp. NPDC050997]